MLVWAAALSPRLSCGVDMGPAAGDWPGGFAPGACAAAAAGPPGPGMAGGGCALPGGAAPARGGEPPPPPDIICCSSSGGTDISPCEAFFYRRALSCHDG